MKYFIGYDLGTSSVKAALLNASTGQPVASSYSPVTEMEILTPRAGFAEQDPEVWWKELIEATRLLRQKIPFEKNEIGAIGISYQMHGLVCIDRQYRTLRPSIIWCDSRAVNIGADAFRDLGSDYCLAHFLNSPGNFTASKLKWVKENEPGIYNRIFKILLPGDFIALKMTGEACTTISGLSEGIFWDYAENDIGSSLLNYYGIDQGVLANALPCFGEQGRLQDAAAELLGIASGVPVCYRAGDQPNNAFSLQVLDPGEMAATAGTSGVMYAVADKPGFDPKSRVNSFIHVNHSTQHNRLGVLMCLNGTGAFYRWLQKEFFHDMTYDDMNTGAARIPAGSERIYCYPFGNGAERILENRNPGAHISGLDFNYHKKFHIARAAQEGIVFSLMYGWEIMQQMGIPLTLVRAGKANMFLSPVFARTFSDLLDCPVELYNTDGALGAARGAGYGCGYYGNIRESYTGMKILERIEPDYKSSAQLREFYENWKTGLLHLLANSPE